MKAKPRVTLGSTASISKKKNISGSMTRFLCCSVYLSPTHDCAVFKKNDEGTVICDGIL